jgi:hypothetical protein
MKNLLLAAGVALAVFGGVNAASADRISVGINVGQPYHHYWWHNRWYNAQPAGYVYVAPPYAYGDPYWRSHWRYSGHCRYYDRGCR